MTTSYFRKSSNAEYINIIPDIDLVLQHKEQDFISNSDW